MFGMISVALNVVVLLLLFAVMSKLDALAKTVARRPVPLPIEAEASTASQPPEGE